MLNDPERITGDFGNTVDMILDGGPLPADPSTVLDLTGEVPEVIRLGAGDVSRLR